MSIYLKEEKMKDQKISSRDIQRQQKKVERRDLFIFFI